MVYMYHSFLIHSSADGHLGCFHVLVLHGTLGCTCLFQIQFPRCVCPGVGLLGHKPAFYLLFHFHPEALQFLLTFCHNGGVICVSEVIDISLAILVLASASSSPAFHTMYAAYKLDKQGDNMQP